MPNTSTHATIYDPLSIPKLRINISRKLLIMKRERQERTDATIPESGKRTDYEGNNTYSVLDAGELGRS